MKNIFKFAGLALISLTMLAACGNKDSEETSYKVTFRGTEYNVFTYAQATVATLDGEQCIVLEGHPKSIAGLDANFPISDVCPGFRIVLRGTTTGTYESSRITDQFDLLGSVRNYEYFNNGWITSSVSGGELYGDWWGWKDIKVELTKFDRKKGLASFTATGSLFNATEGVLQHYGIDAAAKGEMTITVNNMPIK